MDDCSCMHGRIFLVVCVHIGALPFVYIVHIGAIPFVCVCELLIFVIDDPYMNVTSNKSHEIGDICPMFGYL